MRLLKAFFLLGAAFTCAAHEDDLSTLEGTVTSISGSDVALPTGSYLSYESTITVSSSRGEHELTSETGTGTGTDTAIATGTASQTGNATGNATDETAGARTTTSASVTLLVGGNGQGTTTLSGNATTTGSNATSSTSSTATPLPTNTRPCNGYPEFCARNYTNITMVAAHNSPFVRLGNWAANQAMPVTTQLNDGVRMLQFQTHWVNNTIYLCHSSCEILNVGPLDTYLTTVTQWLRQNPYDVVTILMGNSDLIGPGNYTAPIVSSGLIDFVYTPPKIPMGLGDWPTLSSMILSGKRAVVFMDYQANQTEVPYVLDEFSQLWETPFSPTDRNFPCTVQRPPNLPPDQAEARMYMANHNLNLEIDFANINLLIPNSALLNETNAPTGYGSLGWMAGNCTQMWNRPPNFLLVDYYNYGPFNGSVFEVAAELNNVTYNGKCCGTSTSAASTLVPDSVMKTVLVVTLMSLLGVL